MLPPGKIAGGLYIPGKSVGFLRPGVVQVIVLIMNPELPDSFRCAEMSQRYFVHFRHFFAFAAKLHAFSKETGQGFFSRMAKLFERSEVCGECPKNGLKLY